MHFQSQNRHLSSYYLRTSHFTCCNLLLFVYQGNDLSIDKWCICTLDLRNNFTILQEIGKYRDFHFRMKSIINIYSGLSSLSLIPHPISRLSDTVIGHLKVVVVGQFTPIQ